MRRVLILQHDWTDRKGYVGDILEDHGIAHDVVDVTEEIFPDPTIFGAIIALGGIQHVYESDKYPYFTQEKVLMRRAVEQDIPFLGICLGSQLLASALGASVKMHTTPEIGFFEVPFTREGQSDPLYKGLPGYQKVFHWHEDTFDLPSGAILLATNEHTKNQAFRYSRRAYGVQYHIEVTPQMLDTWLDLDHDEAPPELLDSRLHHSDLHRNQSDAGNRDTTITMGKGHNRHFLMYHAHTRKMFENFLSISDLI
jgi:GMP synthase-like glutamine amidotransferase